MVSILESIGGVALVKLDNWRNRLWLAAGEWYDELDFLYRPCAWT